MKTLSTEMPYFNRDLFMEFEEVIAYMKKLIDKGTDVHFLISSYYDIAITGANRLEYKNNPNEIMAQNIMFYDDDKLITKVQFPMEMMYLVYPNGKYIEVLKGIDYSKDKHCGDYVRIN